MADDAFSLHDLFYGIDGPLHVREGDNVAVGDARLDAGYSDSWGYLGYLYRKEVVLHASPDTVELIYSANNGKDLENGREYDLRLDIAGFEVQGIVAAERWKLYDSEGWVLRAGFGLEFLYGIHMQQGYVDGHAYAVDAKDYDFQATSHYRYTHNYLYDLQVDDADAIGYSSHVALHLEHEQVSMALVVNDLYGRLKWYDLPYSDVQIASGNKHYDADGYVQYDPAISGVERTSDFSQALMRKWRVEGSYTFDTSMLTVGAERLEGVSIPYIVFRQEFAEHVCIDMGYESRFSSLGFKATFENSYIGLRTDGLNDISAVSLSFGVHYRL